MIDLQTFLLGLLVVSTLTGLVTEALKKIFVESGKTYRANSLAGLVSLVLSAAVGVMYVLVTGIGFTTQILVCIVVLIFMSWLCAMVGYDKVIQTISQLKTTGEDE